MQTDKAHLYKFRAFDNYGLRLLIDRQLFFAAPSQLNDPMDGRLNLMEIAAQALEAEADEWRRWAIGVLCGITSSSSDREQARGWLETVEGIVPTGGVLSLSFAALDPLLWSHYAAGHTGFCAGFDTSSLIAAWHPLTDPTIAGPAVVTYEAAPSALAVFQAHVDELVASARDLPLSSEASPEFLAERFRHYAREFVRRALTEKSEAWKYEREFRFIRSSPGPKSYEPQHLKRIIFGMRSSEADQRTARNILAGPEWGHIRFYTVKPKPASFEFDLVEL